MAAVLSLLVILVLSFFVTRVAGIALTQTGMSEDMARFQAVSAFTGVGFTTTEAEYAINHPVRRQVIVALMVLGNAGIVTAISSLILSFTNLDAGQWWQRLAWIVGGVVVLWLVRSSQRFGRAIDVVIGRVLDRTTSLKVIDYHSLLELGGGCEVRTMHVDEDDWLSDRRLASAQLFEEGILVLGIHRASGDYLAVPRGETEVRAGDQLVLYGSSEALMALDERRRGVGGDAEHERAMAEHERDRSAQQARDQASRDLRSRPG